MFEMFAIGYLTTIVEFYYGRFTQTNHPDD